MAQPGRAARVHDQAVQSLHHECIVPNPTLALSSRGDYYTSSISFHTSILAAVIPKELPTKQWAYVFLIKPSKSDVVTTLSSSPVPVTFLNKQSELSRALESVLPGTIAFKPSATDTFSLLTAPSHHRTYTTWVKGSRQQKRPLEDLYRQYLQRELTVRRSPVKHHAHSTRPFSSFYRSYTAQSKQS